LTGAVEEAITGGMTGRALACLLLVAACTGDGGVKDEELEGLVVSPPSEAPAVDPGKAAAEGGELGRAFAIEHREVGKRLGAHTVKVTSRIEVKEGDQVVESLTDETLVELAADGQYHARYDNSADYGREVLWQGGALFLRPRYAKWHRRPPTDDDEPARVRDEMYGVAGDYFELVAHAAEVTDKGAAQVAGRDGRRVEIKLAPSPKKPAAQPLTQRKWRESITVQELEGDAVLDAESAIPLQARFKTRLTFSRDGRTFTMTLEVGHEVSGIGQAVALVTPPPEEVVATPERSRETDERDALLEGMAPPSKKAGGSSVTIPGDSK
jgi:hypothetical protein